MTAYQRPRAGDPADLGQPPTIPVTVDGQSMTAYAGQTVAAVLLANGRDTWRTTRVNNRPRGTFCGIGACYDCLVTVNGLPDTRACQRTIQPGDTITTQPGAVLPNQPPTPATTTSPTETTSPDDATSPTAVTSPNATTSINTGPSGVAASAASINLPEEATFLSDQVTHVADVVVVGAGPAGIAAALAAAGAGADVLLVDSARS